MFATPRRLVVLLAMSAVLAMLPLGPSCRAQGPLRLRVLSYNINHGEGTDSRVDLGRITEAIREARPDVVALQEVDRGMERTGRVDQARLIAGRLDMGHVVGGNLEFMGGVFGNAVLSRWPIVEHANHRLPSPTGGEPRGALEATIHPQGGPPFRVISTQLDSRRDDRDRLAAADWLANRADDPEAPPAILAGDLNAGPTDPPVERLGTRWSVISRQAPPTVPADRPRALFDHILVAPAGAWRVVELRVLEEPAASDHRPVLAVLEWVEAPAETPTTP